MYPNDISVDSDNPVLNGDTLASFSIPETRASLAKIVIIMVIGY